MSLWVLSLPEGKTEPFNGARSTRPMNAVFSPDGRWVAYGSDESGTDAVYVQPFPATGAKYQISRGDVGHHALWSRDGKQLFYIPGPGRFVVVNVTTQPSLVSARRFQLHERLILATRKRVRETMTSGRTAECWGSRRPDETRRHRPLRRRSTSSSTGSKN